MRKRRFSNLFLFLLLIILTGTLSGCATGNKIWSYDEETEIQEGAKRHAQLLKQVGAYNNSKLTEYVDTVGKKIAATSDRPKLPWHFTVIDSAYPNAFATQGGYVYITRGMLALLQTDSELAAILSHEIAHICTQDTQQKQTIGNMMGLGVLGMIATAPALLLFPQIAVAPAGAGMAAISRKDEVNADRLGTEYLRRAGYPPEAMQATMTLLESMEAYERNQRRTTAQKPMTWWHRVYASHPTAESRQEKLTEVTNTPNSAIATTPQSEFLAYLEGIEFGSSKHEGIAYGEKRYFMQWNIALEIPDGWIGLTDYKGSELWIMRSDGKARMHIQRITLTQVNQLCEWLIHWMQPIPVTESVPVPEYQNPSCMGIARKSTPTLFGRREHAFRAAILAEGKTAGNGYLFRGYTDNISFTENDSAFIQVAKSLQIFQPTDMKPEHPVIRIRKSKRGDTFSSLAHSSHINDNNSESLLRLLNRRYPDGEPVAGELIKIIE